jgi:hypothetical protein
LRLHADKRGSDDQFLLWKSDFARPYSTISSHGNMRANVAISEWDRYFEVAGTFDLIADFGLF